MLAAMTQTSKFKVPDLVLTDWSQLVATMSIGLPVQPATNKECRSISCIGGRLAHSYFPYASAKTRTGVHVQPDAVGMPQPVKGGL